MDTRSLKHYYIIIYIHMVNLSVRTLLSLSFLYSCVRLDPDTTSITTPWYQLDLGTTHTVREVRILTAEDEGNFRIEHISKGVQV